MIEYANNGDVSADETWSVIVLITGSVPTRYTLLENMGMIEKGKLNII